MASLGSRSRCPARQRTRVRYRSQEEGEHCHHDEGQHELCHRGRSTAPKVRVSEFSGGGVGGADRGPAALPTPAGSSCANAFARSSGGRTSTSSGESGSPGAS
jgi:hypothetical protein